jgi:hypothetical protein
MLLNPSNDHFNLNTTYMNILLTILAIIAIIVAIPLVAALFIKKEYTIESNVTIDKPKQEVFNYVKYLRNQEHYSKWVMMDPAMKKEFKGADGTVGFVYAWDSLRKDAGKGEQEIKGIIDGKRIDVEVRFERPFAGIAYTPISTESISENQTRVLWEMNGKNKYPMNFMNLFLLKMLAKDMSTSLATLKNIVERN